MPNKKCACRTKEGKPCKNNAKPGSKFCSVHASCKTSPVVVAKTSSPKKVAATKTSIYYVVFLYEDYRKEFSVQHLKVFTDRTKAIAFASRYASTEAKEAEYVGPLGTVYDAACAKKIDVSGMLYPRIAVSESK